MTNLIEFFRKFDFRNKDVLDNYSDEDMFNDKEFTESYLEKRRMLRENAEKVLRPWRRWRKEDLLFVKHRLKNEKINKMLIYEELGDILDRSISSIQHVDCRLKTDYFDSVLY